MHPLSEKIQSPPHMSLLGTQHPNLFSVPGAITRLPPGRFHENQDGGRGLEMGPQRCPLDGSDITKHF